MAGKIIQMIDSIIKKKSSGNRILAETTKIKFILAGIVPDEFDEKSEDDPGILEKISTLATELGVSLQ
jgi:hypothetical protein